VSYCVLQASASTGPFAPTTTPAVNGTTATVSGLNRLTPYYFEVVALDALGRSSAPSNVAFTLTGL